MKQILMVDDSTTNLRSAQDVLGPYYQVAQAKSGKQALKFLEKNHPDLILLDLMMPEMDGYETLERIKLNPDNARIPVIILTADTDKASEERGLSMGAMDFIHKPFEPDAMLGRIEKVLQMDEMRCRLMADTRSDVLTGFLKGESFRKTCDSFLAEECKKGTPIVLMIDTFHKEDSYLSAFAKSFKCELLNFHEDIVIGLSEDKELLVLLPVACGKEVADCISNGLADEIAKGLLEIESPIHIAGLQVAFSSAKYDCVYLKLKMAMYHVMHTEGMKVHYYLGD